MILIDSGPLVAMADSGDQYHRECLAASRTVAYPVGTVWPVLTEVMYFLSGLPRAQEAVWDMIARGSVEILALGPEDAPRIRELMQKYADLPMDLADAALVRVAERENTRDIFTIDKKDFSVYRLHGKLRAKILP
jgi:predicted nucleic acid-binding protein